MFRADDGPSILVSTEAGGEGRNFEFCHRLVLYDLPWKPSAVEQRIGRLDRIGRRIPVEIVYFRPPSGIGADVVRLFERLGLFREPMAGVEPQLAHVESALEAIALQPDGLSDAQLEQLLAAAQAARARIHEAAYQQLHRDPYRAALGPSILGRVPEGLDALVEQVVVNAASRLGFRIEQVRGRRAYAIEFGNEAIIDSLPGVPGGSSFVGSFDREYAVEDESIDFFASGHPLVEGLLAHFEEDRKGRVARLEVVIAAGRPGRQRAHRHLPGWSAVRGRRLRCRRPGAAGLGGCVPPPAAQCAENEGRRRRGARLARARDATRPIARGPPPACDRGRRGYSLAASCSNSCKVKYSLKATCSRPRDGLPSGNNALNASTALSSTQ